MGFLSKLMKNPMVQMLAPMALSTAFPMFAGSTGLAGLFGKMNPMAANALKQSMLGYGTAALSGSRRPGKAAMAAGLTSIPFSYMSATKAAKAFNEANQGLTQPERFLSKEIPKSVYAGPMSTEIKLPPKQVYNFKDVPFNVPKITPMDILMGDSDVLKGIAPGTLDSYTSASKLDAIPGEGYTRTLNPATTGAADKFKYSKIIPGKQMELPGADIFTKTVPGKAMPIDKFGNVFMTPPEIKSDFLPTAVSQAAGLYAGRDTPEEEWEAAKKRRKKELAFMYGIDEDQIEGEMDNPYYGGAFMNTGGLASLNMDMGGGVSGPGGPKDDMIDARLSDGEFVMTAKAVENLGGGDRMAGARKMYSMMNMLDPESEAMSEVV